MFGHGKTLRGQAARAAQALRGEDTRQNGPGNAAYAVHTEVGHRTIGARVNQRLVPLVYQLNNGDQVEVLTSKSPNAGPSRDWLNFVASPRARDRKSVV
mgnify:CR=1 FL=1